MGSMTRPGSGEAGYASFVGAQFIAPVSGFRSNRGRNELRPYTNTYADCLEK
jgi:hypothetical protein